VFLVAVFRAGGCRSIDLFRLVRSLDGYGLRSSPGLALGIGKQLAAGRALVVFLVAVFRAGSCLGFHLPDLMFGLDPHSICGRFSRTRRIDKELAAVAAGVVGGAAVFRTGGFSFYFRQVMGAVRHGVSREPVGQEGDRIVLLVIHGIQNGNFTVMDTDDLESVQRHTCLQQCPGNTNGDLDLSADFGNFLCALIV